MAVERTVASPGVWASAAQTVIPPNPVAGTSYRDAANGADAIAQGFPFNTIIGSADFNEIMLRFSSVITEADRSGFLGYSDQVDYTAGDSNCRGSDGLAYVCIQDNGPGSTVVDPVGGTPGFWQRAAAFDPPQTVSFSSQAQALAGTNNDTAMTPLRVAQSFGNQSLAQDGYQVLPGGLVLQWGVVTNVSQDSSVTVTLPLTNPNSILQVFVSYTGLAVGSINYCALLGQSLSASQIQISRGTNGAGAGGNEDISWATIGF